MLLSKFCGKFCCFHRLYILKLGIQHKHEEINWNSELQRIKRAETESSSRNLANFKRVANILQPLQKFTGAAKIRRPCSFDFLTSFLVSPHFVPI